MKPLITTLVGRETGLGNASGLLAGVRAGQGETLLIDGEAGIDKTRLVDSLIEQVPCDGMAVLRGDAHPWSEIDRSAHSWIDLPRCLQRLREKPFHARVTAHHYLQDHPVVSLEFVGLRWRGQPARH